MTDWRPIETAPKDGTTVDLWTIETRPTKRYAKRVTSCRYSVCDKGWVTSPPETRFVIGSPTYWMPVPNPPTENLDD